MGFLSDLLESVVNPAGYIGKKGEKYTATALGFTNFFGYEGMIIRNIYLPKDHLQ